MPSGPSRQSRLLQSVEPTTTTEESSSSTNVVASLASLSSLPNLPKLIIFDLDNTLWTPELYQLRQKNVPRVQDEIQLFADAVPILQHLLDTDIQLAVASRTSKIGWAQQLLDDFEIDGCSLRSIFDYIEIQTGSKKQHLARIRQASGFAYSEMLFIDDDARMNLDEVSSQLGVLCCHTPRGITMAHFVKSLHKYNQLMNGQSVGHWMGHILNADNLGIPQEEQVQAGKILQGRIKFYSVKKRFGFVIDQESRQEFFFHESKVPAGTMLQTGDIVTFESSVDGQGRPSAIILPEKNAPSNKPSNTVSLPCFSMSQPFASLLMNGIKTVESRNNPMFRDLAPGTRVLLHCGRREWHDQESYQHIMSEAGYSPDEINQASRLPKGFAKGNIVGILTIGKTWKASDQERQGADLQWKVLTPFEGIGRFCTKVTNAQWLEKPYKARGNAGVYTVNIPEDCLSES